MLALLAIALLTPLLYIPGYLLTHALLGEAQTPDPFERHYERVVIGALLNGWIAFTMAELGIFASWLQLLILLVFCTIGALSGLRRNNAPSVPLGIVAARGGPHIHSERIRAWLVSHWDIVAFTVVGLVFLALVARPFEVIVGARDAGYYSNTGFSIMRHGGIVQHDDIIAQIGRDKRADDPSLREAAAQAETNFLSKQDATRYLNTGVRASGFFFNREQLEQGNVYPQGFHLFPAWIALLTTLLPGMKGGLLATGLMGFLGLWSVAMLGRRLAGPWVGVLAMLLLALNGAQVWFSRYSTTESTAQFLTFAGLYAFAAMQMGGDGQQTSGNLKPAVDTDETALSSNRKQRRFSRASLYGLIAGVAFGQWALVRIEFLLVIGPILAYLLYIWLTKRWRQPHTILLVSLMAMLTHAALHIIFIARGYFFDTLFTRLQDQSALVATLTMPFLSDTLRTVFLTTPRSLINPNTASPLRLPLEIALLVGLVIVLVLLRRWQRPFGWFEQRIRRFAGWFTGGAALLVVLFAVYGYIIRPQIVTLEVLPEAPGCLTLGQLRQPSATCLRLQGYIGAPIVAPKNPDAITYLWESLPKRLREPKLSAIASIQLTQPVDVRDYTANGFLLDTMQAGETADLLGKNKDQTALLIRNARGVTGWIPANQINLSLDTTQLPVQPERIIARVVNPRWATSLSPGNPGEAEKFGIYQSNFVRVGWYLSPLGVLLAIIGFSLWWWRGMNRASWPFLLIGLVTSFFFIRGAYGTSEQTYIYILRRYVPQVYPVFCLGIAFALVALARGTINNGRTTSGERRATGSGYLSVLVGRWPLITAVVLTLGLTGFLVGTNIKLYRHVEYGGAIDKIEAFAKRFQRNDVLLFRGGAATWSAYRDLPDNIVTPLVYSFGLDALTVKSQQPGNYAAPLARYIKHWQDNGRDVYLVLGASGSLAFPGMQLEKVSDFTLTLDEFEQLTDQKPTNPSVYSLDYTVYRIQPGDTTSTPQELTPTDYAAQVRGFYRPEQLDDTEISWTNGDAVLRLPWPKNGQPLTITLKLAPGKRPDQLGPAQVRVSARSEENFWVENPDASPFQEVANLPLADGLNDYTVTIDPSTLPTPATGTFLLRIENDAWVPAQLDTGSNDQRPVGVQFAGAQLR